MTMEEKIARINALALNTLYVLDEKTGKKTKIVDFERERAARAGKKKENR